MPAEAPPLLPILRSRLQGELLALILADLSRQWNIDELAERTGQPYQTVTAEVRPLQHTGLISASTVGRTKLLSANDANPYVGPLGRLATMAFGPPIVIAEVFDSVEGIDAIYIYGSWAARCRGEPGAAPNDVDVLLIGRRDRDDVYDAARRAERRLGREVNVTQRTASSGRVRQTASVSRCGPRSGSRFRLVRAVPRWNKGADVIERLLDDRHLERVLADADIVAALLAAARRHVASAS